MSKPPALKQPKSAEADGLSSDSYQPPAIEADFYSKHIISVEQFNRDNLDDLFSETSKIRQLVNNKDRRLASVAAGYLMVSLFFESSTRTDLSFQAAMQRLGGGVSAASNGIEFSSISKGENLPDTIMAAASYADIIALRHPEVGSAAIAAATLDRLDDRRHRPSVIINAGDGVGEHPTQALLDLFTILDHKTSLDNLKISLVGDLANGRTIHSLAKLIAIYGAEDATVNLVSPANLAIPDDIANRLSQAGVRVEQTNQVDQLLKQSDVIYWTRIQQERFQDPQAYQQVKDSFIMTPELLNQIKPSAMLMHPLPRKHEMGSIEDHRILDIDPRSSYFEQMENGMFVRMALLRKSISRLVLERDIKRF